MFNDEQLYVAYKQQWIAEHISDEVMTATEASYENNENAKDMTLHEYVENYGFADGSCYADFEEFRDNELEDFQEQTKALFALDDRRVYAADKTACKAMKAVIFHTHCRKLDSEELECAEKDFRENGEKSRYSEKEITELSHDVEKENENIRYWMSEMEKSNIPNWLGNSALEWGRTHDLRTESLNRFFTESVFAVEKEEPEKDRNAYTRSKHMENNIDFNGVKPFETEVCDNLYSVALEKRESSQEDIDRFQYEVMKRSELDGDLRNVGIEINSFEDFQEFRKDSDIQLDIVLNYMSVEDESSKLVASALYGQNSTTISDVPLNDTEQKQFDELCLPAILEDKENFEKAEHGEPDIALG